MVLFYGSFAVKSVHPVGAVPSVVHNVAIHSIRQKFFPLNHRTIFIETNFVQYHDVFLSVKHVGFFAHVLCAIVTIVSKFGSAHLTLFGCNKHHSVSGSCAIDSR